jgi:hypothetical protein
VLPGGLAPLRVLGHDVDGSDAAVERVGADREHGIPIIALWPEGP